jgi:ACS family allantoate permease-like MFS transporter
MPGSIIDTEEKDASNLHEKRPPSEVNYDLEGGDEALHLVGAQRTTDFTEEFNLKLRRKLVSDGNHSQSPSHPFTLRQDLLIPPICAAVYFTQFLDKTSLNYAR